MDTPLFTHASSALRQEAGIDSKTAALRLILHAFSCFPIQNEIDDSLPLIKKFLSSPPPTQEVGVMLVPLLIFWNDSEVFDERNGLLMSFVQQQASTI